MQRHDWALLQNLSMGQRFQNDTLSVWLTGTSDINLALSLEADGYVQRSNFMQSDGQIVNGWVKIWPILFKLRHFGGAVLLATLFLE